MGSFHEEYASSAGKNGWHSVNWKTVNQTVKKVQARIVKAERERKHRKVKALQWILTHSHTARLLAVRRVTENGGKVTAGIDGKIWNSPTKKWEASKSLRRRGYKAKALRRVHIPKANGKKRPLSIPIMKDRAMQALYLLGLEPIAETRADVGSYGFRPQRSSADAIAACYQSLAKKNNAKWILEGDIKSCFDHLSHEWLATHVPLDKKILKQWLKAKIVEGQRIYKPEHGTPQGGVISPTLANMTLDGLEERINKKMDIRRDKNYRKYHNTYKINVIRYADDFIVTGSSREILKEKVKPEIENFLRERGLQLSEEKTKITYIEEGIDFLGFHIRKYKGKLLITPSKRNLKSIKYKIRNKIRLNMTARTVNVIKQINPLIKGWANYYKHVVCKKMFSELDHYTHLTLWRWAKRRHPSKGKGWIKRKYFRIDKGRTWVFADEENGHLRKLAKASDIPVTRHQKIVHGANPYDSKWEEYFEQRTYIQMQNSLRGIGMLERLWQKQKGMCVVCHDIITHDTKWNTHHIQPKHLGGRNNMENLILLHPNCHRELHAQSKKVGVLHYGSNVMGRA